MLGVICLLVVVLLLLLGVVVVVVVVMVRRRLHNESTKLHFKAYHCLCALSRALGRGDGKRASSRCKEACT